MDWIPTLAGEAMTVSLPLFFSYLFGVNLLGFILMGIDKHRARKNLWRISERALFLSALLGGSLGAIFGMRIFHHKTKHWYFFYGMPLILLVQIILLIVTYWKWIC